MEKSPTTCTYTNMWFWYFRYVS